MTTRLLLALVILVAIYRWVAPGPLWAQAVGVIVAMGAAVMIARLAEGRVRS